jgi:uncharacterized protein
MKVQKINSYFRKLAEAQLRYRWVLLLFALVLTVVGVSGLNHVSVLNARDNWFDNREEIEIATKIFEDQFGNNDAINILIESKDVFHPKVLQTVKELGDELMQRVPFADEVRSLTELEVVVGTAEGIRVQNPFEDGIPKDPNKLEEIRKLILSRKALSNKLVSSDCTETWLSLSLVEYPPKEEWEKTTDKDPMFQAGEVAIEVATDPRWRSDLYTLKPAGMPYSETEERDFFGNETKKRVLSGFVAMVILLFVFLRSLRGVLVPVFTTIIGTTVVFGIMGWLGFGIDANMMTLPILLGMALSVGYSIHLVNAFKRFFRNSGDRNQAAIAAVEETGWPIFFTAVTTIGSVMSFAAAGIVTIKWLGYTCAAVVFVDFLFVVILIPILMSFGKDREATKNDVNVPSVFDAIMHRISAVVLKYKRVVLACFALITVVTIPGIPYVSVEMDMFRFIGLKVPYVKRLYEVSQSQLGSYLTYNITIDFNKPDAIKDPQTLKSFDKLLQKVGQFELTKKNENASSVHSILDIIKETNQSLHDDDPAWYKVPDDKDFVAQILLLYEMSGGQKAFHWIDEEYSMLRAQVSITRFQANEIVRELREIKNFGKEHFPDAKVFEVGSAVQFAELNKRIVTGEIKSLITALCVIGVLLVLVFGSLKTGLIGMVPNLAPLVAIGSYMGYFNSPLDMMTMTIMPMLLGIAVDDTIHFINQIKYEFEKCGDYPQAIQRSFDTVGKTLAMTTIVLTVTFIMYMFSPVSNMARIGALASLGFVAALLSDYFVTPTLILISKPFGKPIQQQGCRGLSKPIEIVDC